jgi:phosphate transport system permease protein
MRWRPFKEFVATISIRSSVLIVNAIALFIFIVLIIKAKPIFSTGSLFHLLFSSSWHPFKGEFGFFPFIVGTVEVTALAMLLSVPVCLLSAIYLSEYAPSRLRERVRFGIDILAGIPSVVYGLWGVIVLVPFIAALGKILGIQTTGYSLLTGGIVLAIMVSPVIILISTDVLRMAPLEARESSLALGATKWEAVKHVLLRESLHGITAAIVLGFARAFGETIAVLMVVGNVAKIPKSLFDPAYPLPALIANNYGEVMSVPFYESALLFAALILMVVVGAFSLVSHMTLSKIIGKGAR